jgi:hypothetical protein
MNPKSQSRMMKRDCAQNLIIDSPTKHQSAKLFLILFDVYDSAIISVAAIDSSFKALVNLLPRSSHYANGNELNELSIKSSLICFVRDECEDFR